MEYIAFDSHKHYTLARVDSEQGKLLRQVRLDHRPEELRSFLLRWDPGSPVAVETIGNWYRIIAEIEATGMLPRLVNARKAKLMIGSINKTGKLDELELNLLQRAGTLPVVWIPPSDLRDKRNLPRTRMVFVAQRTKLKNRIQSALAKYGPSVVGPSDFFGAEGRRLIEERVKQLPPQTRHATEQLLEQLDHVGGQIRALEERIEEVYLATEEIRLLKTLPRVGFVLRRADRSRSGGGEPLPERRKLGRLFRHVAAGPRQRWQDALREATPRREPESEVGLHRGGKHDQHAAGPLAGSAYRPAQRATSPAQGAPEGCRSGSPASGGSDLLHPLQGRTLSRTELAGPVLFRKA